MNKSNDIVTIYGNWIFSGSGAAIEAGSPEEAARIAEFIAGGSTFTIKKAPAPANTDKKDQ